MHALSRWPFASLVLLMSAASLAPGALLEAHYAVLPGEPRKPAPFERVVFSYGPRSTNNAGVRTWWQLELRTNSTAGSPLMQLRGQTSRDPLSGGDAPMEFARYQLRIPGEGETLDYRNAAIGRALTPAWHEFNRQFIPRPAIGTGRQQDFPETCDYLGHVLSLQEVRARGEWTEWTDAHVLVLDDELLIGTGRVVKDTEGRRLSQQPERRDYHYVPFTRGDYETMIAAGMNYFGLVPGIERWLRTQPVFYRRDDQGDAPLQFPADFYRANFVGNVMFEDEPACIMVGEAAVNTRLRHFSDVAALLQSRVQALYWPEAQSLESALRARGVGLGSLRLAQTDFPVWETRYETAFPQLEAGFAGFVHEGRYNLTNFYESGHSFDESVTASTGLKRTHTADEMLEVYYAFLRGAARHFGKDWGTSIYGQADPAISPLALQLAYDMGARYLWYWTSDHDHHLPWVEQLQLTRELKAHAQAHPRPSIRGKPASLDTVIVIPRDSLVVIESPLKRRNAWDLWWVRDLDAAGQNAASQRYRAFMRRVFTEFHRALDAKESFDLAADDGRPFDGYRKVVRIRETE